MRQLKITKNLLVSEEKESQFPNLDKTFSNLGSNHVDRDYFSNINYQLLRHLKQDLSVLQYKIIIHETISRTKAFYFSRNINPETHKFFSWTIRHYLLENYFLEGLFLDDIRNPKDVCRYLSEIDQIQYITRNWNVVRSFEEFKYYLENNETPFCISLDHDLRIDQNNKIQKSGFDACKLIVNLLMDNNDLIPPKLYSHSQNPIGKMNILAYYSNFLKTIQF